MRLDHLLRLPESNFVADAQPTRAQVHPRRQWRRQGYFLRSFTSSWVINRNLERYDRVVGRAFWTSQHHAMLK